MKKSTPVTPINAYVSVVCAGGRHHACRPGEWSCGCTCHTAPNVAPSEAVAEPDEAALPVCGSPASDGGTVDAHGSNSYGEARTRVDERPVSVAADGSTT